MPSTPETAAYLSLLKPIASCPAILCGGGQCQMVPLEKALREVEDLLGRYPQPQAKPCGCEACRDESAVIQHGMSRPPAEVTQEEVAAAVWKVHTTWIGDWPELAHFIPAALRFLEKDTSFRVLGCIDLEMLYKKLLVSARPELDPIFAAATPMPPQDRRAIFNAVAAILLNLAAAPVETVSTEDLASTVAFLAQFDAPIEPVLEGWRNDPRSLARARFCALMAAGVLHNDRQPFLGNTYMDRKYRPLPENEGAVAAIFEPSHVAQYLLDHTDDCQALTEEEVYEIGLAWYAAAQAVES